MTIPTPDVGKFLALHREFFEYLYDWKHHLKPMNMSELTDDGRDPTRLAIGSIDVIKGFTSTGGLASPRIAGVVPHIAELFKSAYASGVRDFVLLQDAHPEDSIQFESYGVHCAKGSVESETDDLLAALPFASEFTIMPKESLSPSIGTDFDAWLDSRPNIQNMIIVGDCTDLCVYQFAMYLQMRSVAFKKRMQVIVPENCVQTYNVSMEDAKKTGATPHDGELLHLIFLYHMALNSIKIVTHVD